MEKTKVNTSVSEAKNDKEYQSLFEKMEKIQFINKNFDEKAEELERLSIEFSDKVQEFKEACRELKKTLSE